MSSQTENRNPKRASSSKVNTVQQTERESERAREGKGREREGEQKQRYIYIARPHAVWPHALGVCVYCALWISFQRFDRNSMRTRMKFISFHIVSFNESYGILCIWFITFCRASQIEKCSV